MITIISAYAGHGKDYTFDLIEKILPNVKKIAFADKVKYIISSNIPIEIINDFKNKSKLEILDELKNNHPDKMVYNNLNMRDFLIKLLGGAIRDIEKDIHCLFLLKNIEKDLLDKKDFNYVCTDNRYINEQDYLININLCKTNEQKINYIRTKIKAKIKDISPEKIVSVFENHFSKSRKNYENLFLKNIIRDFIYNIEELRQTKKPEIEINDKYKDLELTNLTKEEAYFKFGVLHIFRPIIAENLNKNLNRKELIEEIKKFTILDDKQIENVFNCYLKNNIEINTENLNKYGFLRTSPLHESESELNIKRKPRDKILNIFNKDNKDFLISQINDLILKKNIEKLNNKKIKKTL